MLVEAGLARPLFVSDERRIGVLLWSLSASRDLVATTASCPRRGADIRVKFFLVSRRYSCYRTRKKQTLYNLRNMICCSSPGTKRRCSGGCRRISMQRRTSARSCRPRRGHLTWATLPRSSRCHPPSSSKTAQTNSSRSVEQASTFWWNFSPFTPSEQQRQNMRPAERFS